MKTHSFTFYLTAEDVTAEDCSSLYESGCDDGTIVSRSGQTMIHFDRDAESLEDAIRSAVRDVQKAGFEVARLEMDSAELIAVAER